MAKKRKRSAKNKVKNIKKGKKEPKASRQEKPERFKVAINGFGRIGKQFFLACIKQNVPFDFVINHSSDIEYIVYLLKYDSVHAAPTEKVLHDGKHLYFGDKKIRVYSELDPEKLPWKNEKVDLVVECTGMFTNRHEAEKHIKAGAKKVLISAPAKGNDITIVPRVNDSSLLPEHTIISAGSCTTNCVAPMMKILNDNFVIKNSFFITTHAYTATQRLIDGIDKKDLRRGRAAANEIVPSTSGASQSVTEALPELKGKLDGYALRVPVVDGSISSIIAEVEKKTNPKTINELFKKLAETKYKGIVEYTSDPIVSADIIGNPSSVIFDSGLTSVNGNLISIAGWYDNEIGYSHRLVDVAKLILSKTE
ncbi:type I glyceraldehyde-3-phosphate dehydrogenase [Candidatus Pacearchaeota archaeon]|nr:type I glyceraldehyde-3-phosphate dehydrogenase [Candidatus Pacearchaeota archaeon]